MNWDRVEQLLNIVDKARLWPNLKKIHDEALTELAKLCEPTPVKDSITGRQNPVPRGGVSNDDVRVSGHGQTGADDDTTAHLPRRV